MSRAAILLKSTRGVDAGKSKRKKHLELVIIFYKITIHWFEYFNNVAKRKATLNYLRILY